MKSVIFNFGLSVSKYKEYAIFLRITIDNMTSENVQIKKKRNNTYKNIQQQYIPLQIIYIFLLK